MENFDIWKGKIRESKNESETWKKLNDNVYDKKKMKASINEELEKKYEYGNEKIQKREINGLYI